ncbi:hypothetical protein SAMN04487896_5152 [Paenibacillus sp. ov031]|uniref:hypothetical protein n=1 Tax=Paenibacillus sp. ov031 TaxID=1761879 RepID=UPI000916783C|nr:hypothetical protein [Paenibacillus sp. ov031]SHN82719.1 hypothetical protein SAMN04487896_5152 [Paenibacillus sp. ov031]
MSHLRRVLISLSILIVCLTGCSGHIDCNSVQTQANTPSEDGFTGYVVAREGNSILVVDPAYEDFGANKGESRYYPAKWFSNAPNPQIGSYVENLDGWQPGKSALSRSGQSGNDCCILSGHPRWCSYE